MEAEIKALNTFFRSRENVRMVREFHKVHQGTVGTLEGEIVLVHRDVDFPFRVEVPANFPLHGLVFYYQGDRVARHLLRQGMVCAISPFNANFEHKCAADFDAIVGWIDQYCFEGKKLHYEYLQVPSTPFSMIFDEEPREFLPEVGEVGEFRLLPVPDQKAILGDFVHAFLADGLAGRNANWSAQYKNQHIQDTVNVLEGIVMDGVRQQRFSLQQYVAFMQTKAGKVWPSAVPKLNLTPEEDAALQEMEKPLKGLYIYLGKEPTSEEGKVFATFMEFWNSIAQASKEKLATNFLQPGLLSAVLGHLPIAVGYPIPDTKEIHWEWMLVPLIPFQQGEKNYDLYWGRSINASASRFFGRGGFSEGITDQNILILGVGAVGSSLAEVLTRGGVKKITVSDPDFVEAGNVCRSTYTFSDIHSKKSAILGDRLLKISPFVNVLTANVSLIPQFRHQQGYQEQKKAMSAYTLIIDCTANDAVAWMLDQMQLDATVINLSISDEAKHLVAVTNTGREAILPAKRQIFSALGQTETKATFYEGAGCWHPTFRASFADINLLLQQYIADANHRLTKGKGWVTTVLETVKGDFGLRVEKREDVA